MINFNELPQRKPASILEKGRYTAIITEASMRQGSDPTRPPYLSLTYTLKNAQGVIVGKLYDNLVESEKDLMRYKIARFVTASGLGERLTNFELRDLAKVVINKTFLIDITSEVYNNKERNIVDVFSGEIYYPNTDAYAAKSIVQETPSQPVAQQSDLFKNEISLNEDAFTNIDETEFDDDFGV